MKKRQQIFLLGFIVALIAILALVVFACNLPGGGGGGSTNEPTNKISESDQKAVATQTVAAGNMLAQSEGESVNSQPSFAGAGVGVDVGVEVGVDTNVEVGVDASVQTDLSGTDAETRQQRNEVTERVRRHLRTAEMFASENVPRVVQEVSDREGYETKVTVSIKDINGVESSYVLYLNFTKKDQITKEQVTEFDDPDEVDDDDDDDVDEAQTEASETVEVITGLLVLGSGEDAKEYEVVMRKTVEVKDGESETEIDIIAKIDDNNYIKIEQEIEVEGTEKEEEFKFTLVENAKVKQRYSMKFEKDTSGELECEIKVYGHDLSEAQIFKFKREVDSESGNGQGQGAKNQYKLKVEYEDKGNNGFKVNFDIKYEQDSQNNKSRYRFRFEGEGSADVCVPRWEGFGDASSEDYFDFWKNFDPTASYDADNTTENNEGQVTEEDPTTENPVVEDPAAEEPAAEDPTAEEPAAEDPTAGETPQG